MSEREREMSHIYFVTTNNIRTVSTYGSISTNQSIQYTVSIQSISINVSMAHVFM